MRNIFTPMVHPWYALFAKFMLSRIEFWASAFSLKFLELSQDFENTVFQSCDFGSISLALQSPVITAEYGIILDQSLYIYRVEIIPYSAVITGLCSAKEIEPKSQL